jgi:hypothetical protein
MLPFLSIPAGPAERRDSHSDGDGSETEWDEARPQLLGTFELDGRTYYIVKDHEESFVLVCGDPEFKTVIYAFSFEPHEDDVALVQTAKAAVKLFMPSGQEDPASSPAKRQRALRPT